MSAISETYNPVNNILELVDDDDYAVGERFDHLTNY